MTVAGQAQRLHHRSREGRDPHLAAATILEHGTDWQKEKFLLHILTGEDIWCQLSA